MNRQKASIEQIEYLVQYWQEHPEIDLNLYVRRDFKKYRSAWYTLIDILNTMTGPSKTWEQWRYSWHALKKKVMRKQKKNEQLNKFELKILDLIIRDIDAREALREEQDTSSGINDCFENNKDEPKDIKLRITSQQKLALIKYWNKHPEIGVIYNTGDPHDSSGYGHSWQELSEILNSLPGPTKDNWKSWRKGFLSMRRVAIKSYCKSVKDGTKMTRFYRMFQKLMYRDRLVFSHINKNMANRSSALFEISQEYETINRNEAQKKESKVRNNEKLEKRKNKLMKLTKIQNDDKNNISDAKKLYYKQKSEYMNTKLQILNKNEEFAEKYNEEMLEYRQLKEEFIKRRNNQKWSYKSFF